MVSYKYAALFVFNSGVSVVHDSAICDSGYELQIFASETNKQTVCHGKNEKTACSVSVWTDYACAGNDLHSGNIFQRIYRYLYRTAGIVFHEGNRFDRVSRRLYAGASLVFTLFICDFPHCTFYNLAAKEVFL